MNLYKRDTTVHNGFHGSALRRITLHSKQNMVHIKSQQPVWQAFPTNPELHTQAPLTHKPRPLHSVLSIPVGHPSPAIGKTESKKTKWFGLPQKNGQDSRKFKRKLRCTTDSDADQSLKVQTSKIIKTKPVWQDDPTNPELHWQIPLTHVPRPLHSWLFVSRGQLTAAMSSLSFASWVRTKKDQNLTHLSQRKNGLGKNFGQSPVWQERPRNPRLHWQAPLTHTPRPLHSWLLVPLGHWAAVIIKKAQLWTRVRAIALFWNVILPLEHFWTKPNVWSCQLSDGHRQRILSFARFQLPKRWECKFCDRPTKSSWRISRAKWTKLQLYFLLHHLSGKHFPKIRSYTDIFHWHKCHVHCTPDYCLLWDKQQLQSVFWTSAGKVQKPTCARDRFPFSFFFSKACRFTWNPEETHVTLAGSTYACAAPATLLIVWTSGASRIQRNRHEFRSFWLYPVKTEWTTRWCQGMNQLGKTSVTGTGWTLPVVWQEDPANPELHWQIPLTHVPRPLHSRLLIPVGQLRTKRSIVLSF